ncbi:hypothetical protein PC129_g24803, partial [Phytophthora cactorum]
MNSLARKAAHSENVLSRASVHLNSAGRSPAYRRLASQLSQNTSRDGARLQDSMLSGAVRSPLRSPLLPSSLRFNPASAVQTRLFHVSSQLSKNEKPKTEKPKTEKTPTEAKEKKPIDPETEAKSQEDETKKTDENEDGDKDGKDGK